MKKQFFLVLCLCIMPVQRIFGANRNQQQPRESSAERTIRLLEEQNALLRVQILQQAQAAARTHTAMDQLAAQVQGMRVVDGGGRAGRAPLRSRVRQFLNDVAYDPLVGEPQARNAHNLWVAHEVSRLIKPGAQFSLDSTINRYVPHAIWRAAKNNFLLSHGLREFQTAAAGVLRKLEADLQHYDPVGEGVHLILGDIQLARSGIRKHFMDPNNKDLYIL